MKPDADLQLPVIFLMGPTATGKSALAVDLVACLPLEIVSVDSAMVYRGMDIGTAKPSPDVLHHVPHHLIDIRDPVETYSAAEFRGDALRCIKEIHSRGHVPLLAGGTGLYFRALEQGLSELPAGNAAVREELSQEAEKVGWDVMHARLKAVDPQAAARIHPHDPQRIQRALEVYHLTGKSLTAHHHDQDMPQLPYRQIKIILAPADRRILHRHAQVRFLRMLDEGLIDEVNALRARGDLNPLLPALRLIGYRQVWQFLDGKLSRADMIDKAVTSTRQLIKRQLTWLRKEQGGKWFDSQAPGLREKIRAFIERRLTTSGIVI